MVDLSNCKVLIVEDSEAIVELMREIFEARTDYRILVANDGQEALNRIGEEEIDLILLDIMMPVMDGFEVARRLKSNPMYKHIPIIFMTGIADENFMVKAFSLGGIDYVTKPMNTRVMLERVRAQLTLKRTQDELKYKNLLLKDREMHLSALVEEKTRKNQQITMAMVSALENANHYNDMDTGNHIRRVSRYSSLLASEYGCDHDFVSRIEHYASLHDVGKVGIPDHILKKPGPLTREEFRIIEQHVVYGFEMLNTPAVDDMAKNIVLYHHERWDGSGYINKLRGEEIPLEARIVSLADVYDALSFKRVYKGAFNEPEIDDYFRLSSGCHFDPMLVELFFDVKSELITIKENLV